MPHPYGLEIYLLQYECEIVKCAVVARFNFPTEAVPAGKDTVAVEIVLKKRVGSFSYRTAEKILCTDVTRAFFAAMFDVITG